MKSFFSYLPVFPGSLHGILGKKSRRLNDDTKAFWKIYITTDFFSENTDGACGNRKESTDTFHKYCFARAIISYNAVNLSHL